jgi:hypothetical protein
MSLKRGEAYEEDEENLEEVDNEIYKIPSNLISCPHCHSANFYHLDEGEESCMSCGLDPNILDYSAPELAHLWKEGSEIRANLKESIPKNASTKLYAFITTLCGPHCGLAAVCPQSRGNLLKCYKEEMLGGKGDEMGKRKVKFKSMQFKKETARKEKELAVLKCSGSGWYHMRYHDKLMDKEKSTHTESGSGAEGIPQSSTDHS